MNISGLLWTTRRNYAEVVALAGKSLDKVVCESYSSDPTPV